MKYECGFSRRRLAAWIVVLLFGVALAPSCASADPSPVKIAVFDFELEDVSAGAGIAGDKADDAAQLNRATAEARQLLAQSGRYAPVDVSAADAEAVKNRQLRDCNGCEAAVARKFGADQSFLGVVRRISRVDYVVRFQIRDAHTGKLVIERDSGLRMGANYSWDRGVASLLRSGLLGQ